MDSGKSEDGSNRELSNDFVDRKKHFNRWGDSLKVYTRKFKKPRNSVFNYQNATDSTTASAAGDGLPAATGSVTDVSGNDGSEFVGVVKEHLPTLGSENENLAAVADEKRRGEVTTAESGSEDQGLVESEIREELAVASGGGGGEGEAQVHLGLNEAEVDVQSKEGVPDGTEVQARVEVQDAGETQSGSAGVEDPKGIAEAQVLDGRKGPGEAGIVEVPDNMDVEAAEIQTEDGDGINVQSKVGVEEPENGEAQLQASVEVLETHEEGQVELRSRMDVDADEQALSREAPVQAQAGVPDGLEVKVDGQAVNSEALVQVEAEASETMEVEANTQVEVPVSKEAEVDVLGETLADGGEGHVEAEVDEVLDSREGRGPSTKGGKGVMTNGMVEKRPMVTRVEDRVRINISVSHSRDEIREIKEKLESELSQVRSLFRQLESKELQLTTYSNTNNVVTNNNVNSSIGGYNRQESEIVERRSLGRVNSEVGSVGHPETTRMSTRVNSEIGSLGPHPESGSLRAHSEMGPVVGHHDTPRTLMRARSEVGSVVSQQEVRPFSRQLSVSVSENTHHGVGEFVAEKEKRTPKANQYYRNSEFLLGKDRLPPESNKKSKTNSGGAKKHGRDVEFGFGFGFDSKTKNKLYRSCSSLLQRLMSHNFGWVFNEPVDVKALKLHDYFDIIKHPMDLGTIKSRLSQNWYKSPREFAEDVRLVFRNAMTYNPKGQDVHYMAEELSRIFEERWAVIETECNPYWRYHMYQDAGLPTPTPRKAAPPPLPVVAAPPAPPVRTPSAPPVRMLDRSESMTMPLDPRFKPAYYPHVGRTPVPKKPKAKDPNKRDMTFEEKQKLSTNLQNLPSEKLDAVVQIIKKRNTALSQHDDEIEVDIDSVDAETLWELDRFVTNYKKSLSKNKRKAELAQARAAHVQTNPVMNPAPLVAASAPKEIRRDDGTNAAPHPPPPPAAPAQGEKQGDNANRSSSSSSSSSDSGSSSSDSDSDSSSADGSDAAHSPRT